MRLLLEEGKSDTYLWNNHPCFTNCISPNENAKDQSILLLK